MTASKLSRRFQPALSVGTIVLLCMAVILVVFQIISSSHFQSFYIVANTAFALSWGASVGEHEHEYEHGLPSYHPSTNTGFLNRHPMCQRLSLHNHQDENNHLFNNNTSRILNAANLWMDHWDDILQATLFPNKEASLDASVKAEFRDLLLDLDPSRLERALLTKPRKEHTQRIWDILEERRKHPNTAPPLRVLVLGGSVTEGVGCRQSDNVQQRACNWSVRLESFINKFLGYNAVHIINIAQGGTGTAQALSIVKYWMYPSQLQGYAPDVIIHAFGSNDSHLGMTPPTELERVTALHEQGVQRLNDFMQTVQSSHACPTPIVVHLDDYFGGHQQGSLIGDFTFRMVLKEVAGWYHNMAVSSAQVVGELVYPNTLEETSFSPKWRLRKGEYNEDVHFGYKGHVAIMWSFVYSALETMVDFCNLEDLQRRTELKHEQYAESRNGTTNIMSSVHELLPVNPPPLDYELRLDTVSNLWKEEKRRQEQHCKTVSKSPPCVMAWVAGPEGRTSDINSLSRYLKPFLTSKDGWEYERDMSHGWSRKLGIVAKNTNATLQFEFHSTTLPTKTLTVQSLKSYGEKWERSEALITITKRSPSENTTTTNGELGWSQVMQQRISGIHNSTSSITYTTELEFPVAVEVGSDIRVVVELVGGSTFKITGMMLCSR